jgi:hypothetical protein
MFVSWQESYSSAMPSPPPRTVVKGLRLEWLHGPFAVSGTPTEAAKRPVGCNYF